MHMLTKHEDLLRPYLKPKHEVIRMLTMHPTHPYLHEGEVREGAFRQYLFRYSGDTTQSNVLLVSHMDTVQPVSCTGFVPEPAKEKQKKNWSPDFFYASGLDDRLGCYLGERLARELKCDHLICDDEECGNSTAKYFAQDHPELLSQYNLIIELDRAGTDVVTYDYSSLEWESLLLEYYPSIGHGSYSDICSFEQGGVDIDQCMVNVGVGYYHAHSPTSFCDIKEVEQCYETTTRFIKENRLDRYYNEFIAVPTKASEYWNDEIIVFCPVCNQDYDIWMEDIRTCTTCGTNIEKEVRRAEDRYYFNSAHHSIIDKIQ